MHGELIFYFAVVHLPPTEHHRPVKLRFFDYDFHDKAFQTRWTANT